MYGDLPESLNLVVNMNHPLVKKVLDNKDKKLGAKLEKLVTEITAKKAEVEELEKTQKELKKEEIPQAETENLLI
jgi:molecular chaperone HtpG